MNKFKLIDLFCGAGGLSSGFISPQFCGRYESVLALDNDKAAVATYNTNFGDHCLDVDIEDWVTTNVVPQADVVIGGPPCQGFSLLNRKRIGDARRALWEPYMDIVDRSGAEVFVMENVPGLLKSQEFVDIQNRAGELGFRLLSPTVLNMADYGVPQTRKRAIIVGVRESAFSMLWQAFPPAPTHQAPGTSGHLPTWRTVYEFIADLDYPEGTEIRDIGPPYNLHFGRNPTAISMQRYKVIPPGGNRFDLQRNRPDITPACWIRKKSGGTDLFGRLWWDRPSVTIRTEFFKPEKGRYLHPDQDRPITHREAARLMTFPDDFIFKGSKVEIARQIGNAVPPAFATVIAEFVCGLLDEREMYGETTQQEESRAVA